MKENVIDVLKYLFESYMDEDSEQIPLGSSVENELSLAGFGQKNIGKAFEWLEDLSKLKSYQFQFAEGNNFPNRIYDSFEQEQLSTEARGFLYYMEDMGILDFSLREIVIERALALETEQINLEQIQWTSLMVLFNISGSEGAFSWIENIVFDQSHMQH
ncbi:MAG: DUF494 domain-containing protein [Gammaproteobacteria bacterium]|nr:DUF494 domain-containing protein [Gammaproteobacteria bacterium]